MKALVAVALGIALAAGVTPALADIVVFNDGRVEEIPIADVTEQTVTVKTPYGEMPYPRGAVLFFWASNAERPGEEYYVAGLFMLRLHNRTKAETLFAKAITLNKQYEKPAREAMRNYSRPPNERPPEVKLNVVMTCTFCGGIGKVAIAPSTGAGTTTTQGGTHGGAFGRTDGTQDGSNTGSSAGTVMATCPACSGRGYRLLEVGLNEGLCPTCAGSGGVRGSADQSGTQTSTLGGTSGSSTSGTSTSSLGEAPYRPCPRCGGSGVLAVRLGGDRGPIEAALTPPAVQEPSGSGDGERMSGDDDGDEDGESESANDEEDSSDGEQSFFGKYRTYLFIGGGALLLVAIVASQMSKKK
ncbi:MAG: hypothetical protein JW889_05305 [Verrucomicrobia bacterium]|nr:hypothetical protein [Verrucomicrobiota bacterium]